MRIPIRTLCTAIALMFACGGSAPPKPEAAALVPVGPLTQNGAVGAALVLTVRITDAKGAAVQGVAVAWAVTEGGGSVSDASSATKPDGTASTTATIGAAGKNLVTAAVAGLSGSPATFELYPPAHLEEVSGGNQTVALSSPVPLVVKVTDAKGLPVAGVVVDWAVTSSCGTLSAAHSTSAADGTAGATATLPGSAQTCTFTAAVPGLAGSPVSFVETAKPLSITPGDTTLESGSAPVTFAAGPAASGDTIFWSLPSGPGTLSAATGPTVSYTPPSNVETFDFANLGATSYHSGGQTITIRLIQAHTWADWPIPPASPSNYTAATDVVTDNVTGLVWQRHIAAQSYDWTDAVAYCKALNLGGFSSGWRLPTLIELVSITDDAKDDPCYDTAVFPDTPPIAHWKFWSATVSGFDDGLRWYVEFDEPRTGYGNPSSTMGVRCVH